MAKDYYFQHDHNPTTDPKIQAMFSVYGDWGYGLFWRIVEMLHREADNSILLKKYVYASFAQHKSTSVEQVATFIDDCIKEFELFQSDGISFWSDRVKRNMNRRDEIKELRSKAGKASAEKRKNATSVEHVLTSVEQNSTKEKKGNEKKGNERKRAASPFAPPTVLEVQEYFAEKGYTKEAASKAHEYYQTADWRDSKGNPVKNWKQKMIAVWFKDENKQSGQNGKPQMVLFKNSQTGANGTMPAEQWQRIHANNPDSSLKFLSNA